MKVHPLVRSFSAGEISPLMYLRDDLPVVGHGAKQFVNLIPRSQGAATTRFGTEFVYYLEDVSESKYLEFRYNKTQSFVLVFTYDGTNKYVYVLDSFGLRLTGGVLTDPKFIDPATNWTTGVAGLSAPVLFNNVDNGLQIVGFQTSLGGRLSVAYVYQSFVASATGTYTLRLELQPGTVPQDQVDLNVGTSAAHGPGDEVMSIEVAYDTTHVEVTFDGVAATTYYVGIELTTGYTTCVTKRTVTELQVYDPTSSPMTLTHSVGAGDIHKVYGEMVPGIDTMFIVGGEMCHPFSVTYDYATDAFTLANLSYTSMPAEWVSGNYPTIFTFFQGRSWWAGCPGDPESIWGSQSADYTNMDLGTSLANEAISYTISKKGAIQWLKGANNLVVGTVTTEYILTSESGLLAPSGGSDTPNAKPQSRTGSRSVVSLDLGNRVVFTNESGTKVHDMGYRWEEDKWIARDISYTSEHLFNDDIVKEFVFLSSPDRIIGVLTEEGEILLCTYDDSNGIIGWSRIDATRRFETIAAITSNGISSLYAGTIYDGYGLQIERSDGNIPLDLQKHIYHTSSSDEITGIEHLSSEEVAVIVDGEYVGDVTLDINGDGTAPEAGTHIVVGKKFTQTLELIPFGYSSVVGSGLGQVKRWNKILIRLVDSYVPAVNGFRPQHGRSDTFDPLAITDIMEDGYIEISGLGWGKDGTITLTQEDPYRIQVTGVYGELEQNRVE